MNEIKRRIAGFEDYEISIWGNVWHGDKMLKPRKRSNKSCYLCVDLYNKNERKTFLINRLVAEAFIPNPDNKPEVNHIDGNTYNNSITNLEWVTHEENIQHRIEIQANDYSDTLFPEMTMQIPQKLIQRGWLKNDRKAN